VVFQEPFGAGCSKGYIFENNEDPWDGRHDTEGRHAILQKLDHVILNQVRKLDLAWRIQQTASPDLSILNDFPNAMSPIMSNEK
jgi:hypothetical protein